jgi:hypothetical protein
MTGRGPDFLGIGAQKAATTWLYRNLERHPGIWLHPEVKEFHYFDDRDDLLTQSLWRKVRGDTRADTRWRRRMRRRLRQARLRGLGWEARFFLRRPSDEWYLSLFEPAGERVAGDITPSYLPLTEPEIRHVHSLLPELRLVMMVRHPVERIWSAMAYFRAQGRGRTWEAVPREKVFRFLDSDNVRGMTDYVAALDRWSGVFGEDRLFVGFTDDVTHHPARLVEEVQRFLGVEPMVDEALLADRINWTSHRTMPGWAARHLAETTLGWLDALERTLGGHAAWWRFSTERLLDLPPDEELIYPLLEGPLWQEWVGRGGSDRYASGVLDDLPRRES